MGRRFASFAMRRQVRDHAGRGLPQQKPPLPASAVEYWHSELGASAAAAVGQILGTTLPAIGTPSIGVDAGYFNNRPVYKSAKATTSAWGATGKPALVAAGQRPWLYLIARLRTAEPIVGPYGVMLRAGKSSGVTTDAFRISGRSNGFEFLRYPNTSVEIINTAQDLNPHVFVLENDATVGLRISVSGVVQTRTNANTQQGLVQPLSDVFSLGCEADSPGNTTGDISVAFFLICSSKPTAPEIAALDQWAQAYWGV